MKVVALEYYNDDDPEPMEVGPDLVVSGIYIVDLYNCLY
jgi:hypothetical protein